MSGRREEEIRFLNHSFKENICLRGSKMRKISIMIEISIVLLFIMAMLWIRDRGICLRIVASGSMEPKLRVGSLCVIEKKYPMEEIEVGDIIAFSLDENTWVTHRVVQISSDGKFLTKGDANETADLGWVSKNQYEGKTIGSIRYMGILCMVFYEQRKKILLAMAGLFLWQQIGRRKDIANKEKT